MLSVVLAHQANWDEILLVAIPLTCFWLLLRLGRRRADDIGAGRTGREDFGLDDASYGSKRQTPRVRRVRTRSATGGSAPADVRADGA